jgi:hypothetical protein
MCPGGRGRNVLGSLRDSTLRTQVKEDSKDLGNGDANSTYLHFILHFKKQNKNRILLKI